MAENPLPDFDSLKAAMSGMSETQAEDFMIKSYGRIPDFWNDPLKRSELLSQDMSKTVVEAHLDQFELAYGSQSRHGSRARAIGDLRNVDGEGMPQAKKK